MQLGVTSARVNTFRCRQSTRSTNCARLLRFRGHFADCTITASRSRPERTSNGSRLSSAPGDSALRRNRGQLCHRSESAQSHCSHGIIIPLKPAWILDFCNCLSPRLDSINQRCAKRRGIGAPTPPRGSQSRSGCTSQRPRRQRRRGALRDTSTWIKSASAAMRRRDKRLAHP